MQATLIRRQSSPRVGQDNILSFIESLIDPTLLLLSLFGVAWYFEGGISAPYLILAVVAFSATFPGPVRLAMTFRQLVFSIVSSWLVLSCLIGVFAIASGYIFRFHIKALYFWVAIVPVAQLLGHLVLRWSAPCILGFEGMKKPAVIVGMNDQGVALAQAMQQTPYSNLRLAGFFDDRASTRLNHNHQSPLIGPLSMLPAYVKEHGVQVIYLSLPMATQPRIIQLLNELRDTTASIYFVPDMFVTDLIQGRVDSVGSMPVVAVCETPFTGTNGLIKRLSDIVISVVALILISPLLLIIAFAVKLTSPGPVIFKQRRYGLDGADIIVYKFRSMTVCEDGASIKQAQQGDKRITRLGAFLRKSSLDELPQFINVLQGRMSVVGPRPHAIAHNEMYRKLIMGYMIRHKVRPGITGWAQVNGSRGETETLEKMQARITYDLEYLRKWSLGLDAHIIARTVTLVLKDQNAF